MTINGKDKEKDRKHREIHIVYNCKEKNRIIDLILSQKPDVLYYIHHKGKNEDIYMQYRNENLAVIKKKLPNCAIKEKTVNYIDYYDIISNLAALISKEKKISKNKKAHFLINLGTGSKMVAIANIDAHRLWSDVDFAYPYSLEYDPTAKQTHQGTMRAADPPKLEFRKPEIKLIKCMQIMLYLMHHDRHDRDRNFIMQKDWQDAIFSTYKVHTVKKNKDPRKFDSSQKISLRRIIKKLEDVWQFITLDKIGRSNRIYFTDRGLKLAKVLMNYDYGLNFE